MVQMVLVRKILSIAELAAGTASLAPEGAAAFASSGERLAIEADGGRVLIADARDGQLRVLGACVLPVRALALHTERGSGTVAVGAADGRIALQDAEDGHVRATIATGMKELTALAFSPDGKLLAAADIEGHIVVYQTALARELRRLSADKKVCAIAVHDSGSPVLTANSAGTVTVHNRVTPPRELAGNSAAVTSLSFPVLCGGQPLAGRADGEIAMIDPAYQRFAGLLATGSGPVRAVWAGSCGQVRFLASDGELCCWAPRDDATEILQCLPQTWRDGVERVLCWWRDLQALLSAFGGVRTQMRDEVGGEHAEVVARLDGIDETTRERVRKVVVKSLTVLDSESFDRALARVFDVNPLPLAMLITAAALVLVVVPLVGSAAALASLGSAGGWLTVLGVVTVGLWVLVRLGRLGVAGRTLRALIVAFGVVVGFAGPKVTWSEPGSLRHLAARWLPAAAGLKVNLSIPYPVWLGFSIVVYVAVTVTGALLLVWLLERLSRPAEPRQVPGDSLVAGGRLLHALLDVAYQAQKMVDNPELAASSRERARLHRLVQVAASTASRQWVKAMRTKNPRADRIIRDQGAAICAAIRRWERQAALGGAQLPMLSMAFAIAGMNAAQSDWGALAGDIAPVLSRRRRAWKLVGQALPLVLLLGAAAGIGFGIHPLPAVLGSLLTFLIGLAVARVLRWLDLASDIDPAMELYKSIREPR